MSVLANYEPANTNARIDGRAIVIENAKKDKMAAAQLRWLGFESHRTGDYVWRGRLSAARAHLVTIIFPRITGDARFWQLVAEHLQACIDGRKDYFTELGISKPYRETGWTDEEIAESLGITKDDATRLTALPYPY